MAVSRFNKIIAGYISLFCGLYLFYGLNYQTAGFFMQGMALGFFGSSLWEQWKELKEKLRARGEKNPPSRSLTESEVENLTLGMERLEHRDAAQERVDYIKKVINGEYKDHEKIQLLGLKSSRQLRRLEQLYKDKNASKK
jgi:hypothetical protein